MKNRTLRKRCYLTASMLALAITQTAIADEYHYKNILIGSKAIGLGGAFTGIADDMSAVFYNPAGLAQTTLSNSASLSTFRWEAMTFEDVFSTQDDFERSSFSIVPSFLGTGSNSKVWNWSLVFAVSDLSTERNFSKVTSDYYDPTGSVVIGSQTEFGNIDLDNASYDLGLGGAFMLSERWSMGASLILKYKQFETVQGSGIATEIPTPQMVINSGFVANRRIKDENVIVTPQFGILYKGDSFGWGLKAAKDFAVSRKFSATHQIIISSPVPIPPTATATSVAEITGSKRQDYATNIATGIFGKLGNFTVSFDMDYFSDVDVNEFEASPFHPPITRDLAEVINYSLGLDYQLSKNNHLKLGVFTDNANGFIDPEQRYQRMEVIDMLGVSAALKTNAFGFPISIGAYYKYGRGDVRLSDIRMVEKIVGLPLYPESATLDTRDGVKESFVFYLSANF
mgnify:CR=1 FL=1